MYYCGLNTCDTTNGEGVHASLFVSGCSLKCKGCFNKEAWDRNYGKPFDPEAFKTLIEALKSPYVNGLSILGGDPLEDYNIPVVEYLVGYVKLHYPDKQVWLWTGRTFDKVKDLMLMKCVDVLITEPFILKKKVTVATTSTDGKKLYYGSTNQRVYRKSPDNPDEFVRDYSC